MHMRMPKGAASAPQPPRPCRAGAAASELEAVLGLLGLGVLALGRLALVRRAARRHQVREVLRATWDLMSL